MLTDITKIFAYFNSLATKIELKTVENKTHSVNSLVTKSDFNTKATEIVDEIPDATNLAFKTALNAVESKIPSVSNLVKKLRIIEIENKINNRNHDQYIITQEFNDLTVKNFTARIKQADFVTKRNFDDKLKGLNQKINSNGTKCLLVENETRKLKKLPETI